MLSDEQSISTLQLLPPAVQPIERVTILKELPSGNIRLELGADGIYLLFDADCLDALPYCKAQCCSIHGIEVDEDEVESLKDLATIVRNEVLDAHEMKRDADGFCNCLNRETRQCNVYEHRPYTCRSFHCTRHAYSRGFKLPCNIERLRGVGKNA